MKPAVPAPKTHREAYEQLRIHPPNTTNKHSKATNGQSPVCIRKISAKKIPAAINMASRSMG